MRTDISVALGLPSPGTQLHYFACRRMLYAPFQSLANILGVDEETLGRGLWISPELLSKRANTGLFSLRESKRLYALIAVVQASCDLFEGDVQSAATFLRSPSRGFNSKSPLEMLLTGGQL
jgi:putative toxin-antitoxin system antitoxin component (TIGR02293 family)